MGLLDQLQAYIKANTPRATRPVAKPSQVINEGLLNPNKFNAPAANRFKDSAFGLLGVVPGVGDAASAAESADLFKRGEKFAGSMAALGALPLVPAIGGMFVGKGAKTWDVLKAQQAEELLKQGIDPREVWKQTGTAKFADGMLRQEIPDNLAAFKKNGVRDLKDFGARKEGSIFEHGDLYNAYPETADIVALRERGRDYSGYFTGQDNNIGLTFPDKKPDMESLKSLNVHELQHAIQQREGWARGGSPEAMAEMLPDANDLNDARIVQARIGKGEQPSEAAKWVRENLGRNPSIQAMDLATSGKAFTTPDSPMDAYRKLAGEAEARLTQSRMNLDAAQRLQHYPYDMGEYGLDVPMDQLIVRGGLLDNGPAMSINPKDYGLPVNPDGTVSLFHGTTKAGADGILRDGRLKSAGEPDVYLTNAKDAGYGDGSLVQVDVDPRHLNIDDEFPDGRYDFRMPAKKAKVKNPKIVK